MYALNAEFAAQRLAPPATVVPVAMAVEASTGFGEAAAPDVPGAVGWMMLAVYGAMILSFLALYTRSGVETLMVVVSTVYGLVYFGVPAIIARVEGRSGKVGFNDFLRNGMQTWTGHVSGREAIIHILSVPVAATVGITTFGLIWLAIW